MRILMMLITLITSSLYSQGMYHDIPADKLPTVQAFINKLDSLSTVISRGHSDARLLQRANVVLHKFQPELELMAAGPLAGDDLGTLLELREIRVHSDPITGLKLRECQFVLKKLGNNWRAYEVAYNYTEDGRGHSRYLQERHFVEIDLREKVVFNNRSLLRTLFPFFQVRIRLIPEKQ